MTDSLVFHYQLAFLRLFRFETYFCKIRTYRRYNVFIKYKKSAIILLKVSF